jgi:hypothetical protein
MVIDANVYPKHVSGTLVVRALSNGIIYSQNGEEEFQEGADLYVNICPGSPVHFLAGRFHVMFTQTTEWIRYIDEEDGTLYIWLTRFANYPQETTAD